MDDFGIVYIIETAQQFWAELEDILQIAPNANLSQLDGTLRRFVSFCVTYHEQYLQTPAQLDHACHLLLSSELFAFHSERMSDILIKDAEQTTDPHTQLVLYKILLMYGRTQPKFLKSHKKWQPLIPLLMDYVLLDFDPDTEDNYAGSVSASGWYRSIVVPIEARLRLLAVGILYEVCRVQKLVIADLRIFNDAFIDHLFELVEQTRHMHDETLNYNVIKLIVALNEQFMLAAIPTRSSSLSPDENPNENGHQHHKHHPPEEHNRVIRVLIRRLGSSKTFYENMIFMLNRADRTPEDMVMQLLILKILYLLFTTNGTSEHFYTNDLCVLVDVFIRELVDLDEDSDSLRHTYLRVLHPLLTRTQLRTNSYKRAQIVQTLESLIGNSNIRDVSSTTRRLVERCLGSEWCAEYRKHDLPRNAKDVERVSSPGGDSVASASRTEMIASATHVHRNDSIRSKGKGLKSSRSVENIKSQSTKTAKSTTATVATTSSSSSASILSPHITDLKQKTRNDSAFSLVSVAAAVPTLPPSASSSKRPMTSQSISASTPELADIKSGTIKSNPRGLLGQIITAPVQGHHSAPPSASLSPSGNNTISLPPSPPRRRKPPAVPVRRNGQSGGNALVPSSSNSSSSSTQSPLSRFPVRF